MRAIPCYKTSYLRHRVLRRQTSASDSHESTWSATAPSGAWERWAPASAAPRHRRRPPLPPELARRHLPQSERESSGIARGAAQCQCRSKHRPARSIISAEFAIRRPIEKESKVINENVMKDKLNLQLKKRLYGLFIYFNFFTSKSNFSTEIFLKLKSFKMLSKVLPSTFCYLKLKKSKK